MNVRAMLLILLEKYNVFKTSDINIIKKVQYQYEYCINQPVPSIEKICMQYNIAYDQIKLDKIRAILVQYIASCQKKNEIY